MDYRYLTDEEALAVVAPAEIKPQARCSTSPIKGTVHFGLIKSSQNHGVIPAKAGISVLEPGFPLSRE